MRKRQPNHIICFILTFLLLSINIQVFAGTVVHVTKVSLSKTTDTLIVGKTDTLKATVAPTNVTNKAVKWTSSNIHVAKVNSNGKVTALAIGYANITATSIDGRKINHCTVTVKTSKVAIDPAFAGHDSSGNFSTTTVPNIFKQW